MLWSDNAASGDVAVASSLLPLPWSRPELSTAPVLAECASRGDVGERAEPGLCWGGGNGMATQNTVAPCCGTCSTPMKPPMARAMSRHMGKPIPVLPRSVRYRSTRFCKSDWGLPVMRTMVPARTASACK